MHSCIHFRILIFDFENKQKSSNNNSNNKLEKVEEKNNNEESMFSCMLDVCCSHAATVYYGCVHMMLPENIFNEPHDKNKRKKKKKDHIKDEKRYKEIETENV